MKISFCANSNIFPKQIIDIHGHIGTFFDGIHQKFSTFTPEQIVDTVTLSQGNKVKNVFISNINGLTPDKINEISANEEVLNVCNLKGKNILLPLASCLPKNPNGTKDIEKVLNKNKFYGLKFHPSLTKFPIQNNENAYLKYFELAQKKELPCLFHCTSDGFSNPENIISLAKKYPKLPIVLYHIDLTGDKFEAIDKISEALDKKEANLFIDISWIFDNNLLKYAIDKLGIDRIMFGTDTPIAEMGKVKNYSDYIKNIASVINEYFEEKNNPQMIDKAIDNIFYNNAKNLFIKQKTLDLVA